VVLSIVVCSQVDPFHLKVLFAADPVGSTGNVTKFPPDILRFGDVKDRVWASVLVSVDDMV
jgi:hypothetical protein